MDREGHRPIHLAMKQKFVEVVEILLDAGVLVDQKNAQVRRGEEEKRRRREEVKR